MYMYVYICCIYSLYRSIKKENTWVCQSASVSQVHYKTIMGMSGRACCIKIMHICIMNIHCSREFRWRKVSNFSAVSKEQKRLARKGVQDNATPALAL